MRAHDPHKERHDRERDVLCKLGRVLAEEARGGVLGEALESLLGCGQLEAGGAFTVELTQTVLVAERGLAPLGRPGAAASRDLRPALTEIAARVTTSRKPLRLLDQAASDLTPSSRSDLASRGYRSVVAQPLRHQREVLGVIVLLSKDPASFDASTLSFLETAGHMLALAIERDRRGEREASYRDELVQTGNMAMLGVLTASVGHELRAAAGSIATQLGEQARIVGDLGESATEWTRPMLSELAELGSEMTVAATEMAALVGQLSSVSRRNVVADKMDLSALVREGVSASKSELRRRGVTPVEDYSAGCVITARRDNLVRVVLSLLFNAVDACTSAPHPQPKVAVRTSLEGNRVVLSIDDTGPPIPPEELHAVFQPLYSSPVRGQRIGIGLKICSDVVIAEHGNIDVVNLPGGGVSFRISLPRTLVASIPCDPSDRPTDPPPDGETDLRRVFMVDDDQVFTRALERSLKPHEVRSATTASEAELILLDPAYNPHIILCDVGLPGMTGDILHARMVSKRPALAARFVFVTGGACSRSESEYLQSSGCATLKKPLSAEAIWDAVTSTRHSLRAQRSEAARTRPPAGGPETLPPDTSPAHRYSDLPTLPPDTFERAL